MRWLVTAGGTQLPIDRVRAIGNPFTVQPGAAIAAEARRRGHRVTLLTSNFAAALEAFPDGDVQTYRTFDDLSMFMGTMIETGLFDCIVHSAAVSDYSSGGI